jgi:hypothetical protein
MFAYTLQDAVDLLLGARSELWRWRLALVVGGVDPVMVLALVSLLGSWRVMLKPRWTWSFPLLSACCCRK